MIGLAYYNEIDPFAAEWLRNLIAAGHIAPGDVDERSIEDVTPDDLNGYTQLHFFAGIGGWSYALRLAGWPDDRPVWTGSCPCQPFSVAGKGKGTADERHLWPAWHWLISQCGPAIIFGEQVASKVAREGWLPGVQADLETLGYRFGAADLCAAGVGAPHIRQRLWWVADTDSRQRERVAASKERYDNREAVGRKQGDRQPECGSESGGLGHTSRPRTGRDTGTISSAETQSSSPWGADGRQHHGAINASTTWLPCADGKARRIEPGLEPLAHGIPGRVGLLRGYGNAIVPQVGAEFVRAYMCEAHERNITEPSTGG